MAKDFDEVIQKTVNYWLGKPNNPLNGKSFKEIYEAVKNGELKNED